MEQRCLGCMRLKQNSPLCEHCGFDENSQNSNHQLPLGTEVGRQYILGKVLGQGGFGITYIGWDKIMNTPVAVKEYFPSGYAGRDTHRPNMVTSYDNRSNQTFANNKQRFLREAESLSKLWNIPQIVRVLRHFEDNGTAYIAMEYVEGTDLRKYLKQQGKPLTVEQALDLLGPIIQALGQVHKVDLVHRDISPDNIMVLPDGSTKLLDFGAARYVENADAEHDRNTSTQAILKHGFAPPEQYSTHGALGPWTDVYAMCASLYFCLTGKIPMDAMNRMMEGEKVNWAQIPGLSKRQIAALDAGMALQPKARLKSMEELHNELFAEIFAAKEKQMQEQAAAQKRKEESKRRLEAEQLKEQQRKEAERLKEQQCKEVAAKRLEEKKAKEAAKVQRQNLHKETKDSGNTARKKLPLILAASILVVAVFLGIALFGKSNSSTSSSVAVQTPPLVVSEATEPYIDETTVADDSAWEVTPEATTQIAETTPPLQVEAVMVADGMELGYSVPIEILSAHALDQIHWTSANPEIANVSADGIVTTVGYGVTEITGELAGQVVTCRFIVYPKANVDCTYVETASGVTITGYKNQLPAKAILPMYINGKPVTGLGDKAFEKCGWLTSILLPEGITYIGSYAFNECTSLSSINLPDSIRSIGNVAFYNCDGLKNITIPNSVTVISASLFRNCDGIESIYLPDSIQKIEDSAFMGCNELTSIEIPDGVTAIGYGAFFSCDSLQSVKLPQRLTEIEGEAFASCDRLTDIQIPDGISSIGGLAFYENAWLTQTDQEFLIVGDGILVKYNGTEPHVQIPAGVKSINSAFADCRFLESVIIPESVISIEHGAFRNCTNLTSVDIPKSVKRIDTYAFQGCSKLDTASIASR